MQRFFKILRNHFPSNPTYPPDSLTRKIIAMSGRTGKTLSARTDILARNFPENGMEMLLEHPGNVRDLLALTGEELVQQIDLDRMRLVPTTFIASDYRLLASDVVLVAPFRNVPSSRRRLMITILIEHQSVPDPLMPLRMVDYVTQVFRRQERRWRARHGRSFEGFRLLPVLPVVFHTGTRPWERLGTLPDLIETGERFRRLTPVMECLFVNLPAIPAGTLEPRGGFLGWVLQLVQARRTLPAAFSRLVDRVLLHMKSMPEQERARGEDLLSYIHAFVYHERDDCERIRLEDKIKAAAWNEDHQRELYRMGKTIAEALRDEGRVETARSTLFRLLSKRFGEVPQDIADCIEETSDLDQLNAWVDRIVTAETLKDMRIEPQS